MRPSLIVAGLLVVRSRFGLLFIVAVGLPLHPAVGATAVSSEGTPRYQSPDALGGSGRSEEAARPPRSVHEEKWS